MCLKPCNSTDKIIVQMQRRKQDYPSQPALTETTFSNAAQTSENQTNLKSCNTFMFCTQSITLYTDYMGRERNI